MKILLSISLALLILLQSFNKVWIIFSFKVNQDYIAKMLCINRDKPELQCNGKCVLMQRIKASEEKEKKEIPLKMKGVKEVVYCFYPSNWQIQFDVAETIHQPLPTFYQSPGTSEFVPGVFHPPQVFTV